MIQSTFEWFIIENIELFSKLQAYADKVDSSLLSYDLETDDTNERKALIMGIGLAWTDAKAFYIPLRKPDKSSYWSPGERSTIIAWLVTLLGKIKLLGHNIIYDVLISELEFSINDLASQVEADTILMKHTLDEEKPFGLKELSVLELGPWADLSQEELRLDVIGKGGRWTKDEKDMWMAETKILGKYCCWDVILTRLLYNIYNAKLKKEGLDKFFYQDEVMPLYREVTIPMKRNGFPVDVEYYKKLKEEISKEIDILEDDIYKLIYKDIKNFEDRLLEDELPWKSSGNFPKYYADAKGITLPLNSKTGKVTLSKKAVELQKQASNGNGDELYDYILGLTPRMPLDPFYAREAQKKYFFEQHPESKYIFNLKSNDHLIELVFNQWNFAVMEKTPGGKPKVDDDYFDTIKGNPVVDKLKDYKKLNKLLNTYVEGILDRQVDAIIYTSMLQFGTTSGRYASRNPNLQNQPRIKDEDSGLSALVLKYVNAIRKGFIAGKGRKIVNVDYSSLEPVCFAHASGDQKLRDVFKNGEDLYSRVAIETFGLTQYSANKKDPMYLKNHKPEIRQNAKEFCLAVPYGAEAAQVSRILNISYKEADEIIKRYLGGFKDLQKYMYRCNYEAKTKGYVSTEFGRIRHLKEARSIYTLYGDTILDAKYAKANGLQDIRRKFKNCLNNAKNFPIQGAAASIVNRAMIAIAREFKKQNIKGWVGLQVHDEITCIVEEQQAQIAAKIVQDCMENTTKISIPLSAVPLIADNWGDAK